MIGISDYLASIKWEKGFDKYCNERTWETSQPGWSSVMQCRMGARAVQICVGFHSEQDPGSRHRGKTPPCCLLALSLIMGYVEWSCLACAADTAVLWGFF